jgi:hypothetical protein
MPLSRPQAFELGEIAGSVEFGKLSDHEPCATARDRLAVFEGFERDFANGAAIPSKAHALAKGVNLEDDP